MKTLCLGTAMWGWSVSKEDALKILDEFYYSGGRYVDTATNYPINNMQSSFGMSLNIINEWLITNNVNDLKVIVKIGSVYNKLTDICDLSKEAIYNCSNSIFNLLGQNLYCLMIHWDNRECFQEILESTKCLKIISESKKIRFGISGIKHIDLYKKSLDEIKISKLDVEAKSNFFDRGEIKYNRLKTSIKDIRIWGYGISGSGLKLDKSSYNNNSYVTLFRPSNFHEKYERNDVFKKIKKYITNNDRIESLYQLAIVNSELNEELYGYLVAPTNVEQLKDINLFRNGIKDWGITFSDWRMNVL